MHLVGFIIRIYQDELSSECQNEHKVSARDVTILSYVRKVFQTVGHESKKYCKKQNTLSMTCLTMTKTVNFH